MLVTSSSLLFSLLFHRFWSVCVVVRSHFQYCFGWGNLVKITLFHLLGPRRHGLFAWNLLTICRNLRWTCFAILFSEMYHFDYVTTCFVFCCASRCGPVVIFVYWLTYLSNWLVSSRSRDERAKRKLSSRRIWIMTLNHLVFLDVNAAKIHKSLVPAVLIRFQTLLRYSELLSVVVTKFLEHIVHQKHSMWVYLS
jgi:hypothetical protein